MKYQVIIIGGGPAGYTAGGAGGERGLGVRFSRRPGGIAAGRSCR